MRLVRGIGVALAALCVAAPFATAARPAPRASLPDIEDEVMCPICGTLLQLAESPQANDERAFIRQRIASGETKQQIEDDLVAEYGPQVLASPPASGFDLSAYLVPAGAFVAAAVAIAFALRRWRRAGDEPSPGGSAPLDESETERLDADLARYDL